MGEIMSNTHKMHLRPGHFEKMQKKEKTVEFRLYDKKRKGVNIDDGIIFINTETKKQVFTVVRAIIIGKLSWVKRALDYRMNSMGFKEVLNLNDELAAIYGSKSVTDPIELQPLFVAFILEV